MLYIWPSDNFVTEKSFNCLSDRSTFSDKKNDQVLFSSAGSLGFLTASTADPNKMTSLTTG